VRQASLKDVAARAGVSIKTVSNVVNGYAPVSPETRARVERAVDELGYRPNRSARHLRTGRSGVIALAVPELTTPYFAELASEVIAAARVNGLTVLIEDTGGEPETELRIACGLDDPLIDGVILSPLRLDQSRLADRSRRVPLVLLGEQDYQLTADHVLIDNVTAARQATEHLLDMGYRRIAAIGYLERPPRATAQQRMQGYLLALLEGGVSFEPVLAPPVIGYRRANGAAAMRALLALPEPPDAVFCFNDLLALGAMRTAFEMGVRVPDDLAVVGFDDVEEARYATPSLTTVAPDKGGIARRAVGILVNRIIGADERPPAAVHADHRLVIRESSRPHR
jgi:DNA-binding LacI/PurR family transcriptional regulator